MVFTISSASASKRARPPSSEYPRPVPARRAAHSPAMFERNTPPRSLHLPAPGSAWLRHRPRWLHRPAEGGVMHFDEVVAACRGRRWPTSSTSAMAACTLSPCWLTRWRSWIVVVVRPYTAGAPAHSSSRVRRIQQDPLRGRPAIRLTATILPASSISRHPPPTGWFRRSSRNDLADQDAHSRRPPSRRHQRTPRTTRSTIAYPLSRLMVPRLGRTGNNPSAEIPAAAWSSYIPPVRSK